MTPEFAVAAVHLGMRGRKGARVGFGISIPKVVEDLRNLGMESFITRALS